IRDARPRTATCRCTVHVPFREVTTRYAESPLAPPLARRCEPRTCPRDRVRAAADDNHGPRYDRGWYPLAGGEHHDCRIELGSLLQRGRPVFIHRTRHAVDGPACTGNGTSDRVPSESSERDAVGRHDHARLLTRFDSDTTERSRRHSAWSVAREEPCWDGRAADQYPRAHEHEGARHHPAN